MSDQKKPTGSGTLNTVGKSLITCSCLLWLIPVFVVLAILVYLAISALFHVS